MKPTKFFIALSMALLGFVCFQGCDDNDMPEYIESAANSDEELSRSIGGDSLSNDAIIDSLKFFELGNTLLADSILNDSTVMMLESAVIVDMTVNDLPNGMYDCMVEYRDVTLCYITDDNRFFPPREGVHVLYDCSGLGSVDYVPTYTEASRTDTYVTVNILIKVRTEYLGLWTDVKHVGMKLTFDRSTDVRIDSYFETKAK